MKAGVGVAAARPTALAPVTNGAERLVKMKEPYAATISIKGSADLVFHAWNCEAVKEKGDADKGSKAKQTDDIESYVFRDEKGQLCLPGGYLRATVIDTARFKQDPRSKRKSAMDLFKAGIVVLTPLAPLNGGVQDWDYLLKCRMVVQRQGITRVRPAFLAGWTATVKFGIALPEYISPALLNEVLAMAGRVNGMADSRPTYGRFQVVGFEVGEY